MTAEQIKNTMTGFVDFIRTQGVVSLAVGIMLGGAVGKVVQSLVNDVIMPSISIFLGSTDEIKTWSYGHIMYGNFLANLINFVLIAAVVYFGVKLIGLEKLDKPKD